MAKTTRSRYPAFVFALILVMTLLPGAPAAMAQVAPDWTFSAETPFHIWSNGGGWAIGTEILVLVNDGVSGPEFSETATVEQTGPDPTDVGWSVHTDPFEIGPGDLITVYEDPNEEFDRQLEVLHLVIDPIDPDLDTITGTAPVGATVEIHASDGTVDANRSVVADGIGVWKADFNIGDTFDIRPGTWGSAAIFEADGDATHRNWQILMPWAEVNPQNDSIQGYWWEIGATVNVEINDPATGSGVDWADSAEVVAAPWDPSQSYVDFQPGNGGFDVLVNHSVTMTDGTIVKDLTVAPLAITDVNTDSDLVHGTATPNNLVSVWISGPENMRREVTAASNGSWTADFSVSWDGFDARDIGPGDRVDALEHDADDDATRASSNVPNPQFSVETPHQIWSNGDGWIAGRTVTVTVDDDHDLGNGTLYSTTSPVVASGPEPWEVGWNVNTGTFEIAAGHVVTVDDGVDIARTLDVVDLVVTEVNEATDTIRGTAPPNAWVGGHANDGLENANRRVQAGADGTFTIDFGNPSVEGWEQTTLDIRPGVGGSIAVFDDDNDSTHRSWRVADPYIGVNVIHEELWAVDWPIGATLSFTVEDPTTPESPDTDGTMTVVETSWGQTEAGYRFWGDFDVQGGQVITVTDGTLTRTLEVSTLVVTNVDPDSDRYEGTFDPTDAYYSVSEVCAWARDLSDPQQWVEHCALPNGDGDWVIDFTGIGDVVAGDHSNAWQIDGDGDRTEYAWFVPPWIYVEIGDDANPLFPDRIQLDRWAFPVTVTNGTDTVVVSDTYGDGWETIEFDVTPGQTITATGNDGLVKNLYLEDLAVTTVTLWNEDPPSTVFGTTTATYAGQVQVTASADYGWWTERWVPATVGLFEADFDKPGNGWREQELGDFGQGGDDDVYSGGEIRAHIWDADNDQIQTIWHATNPRIIIVRGNDRIEAIDFPLGELLTIELDDPTFAGIEFSETGTVGINPDKPWETLLIFEMDDYTVPDEATVTALDAEGTPLVETEVIPFTVDDINHDEDTIAGTAAEGSKVLVQADGNWRYPIADETNTWVADFSQPGSQPGEESPVDIGPGSSGGATLLAEGGSATTVLWRLSAASFGVDPTQNNMWGNEFAPNGSVNITVDSVDQGDYPTDGSGQFNAGWDPADLDLAEDMLIEVTDGATTKTHTVTALVVTDVNDTNDTVSGTAAPGSDVDVWVHDSDVWRHVVADDTTGVWTADFSVAGDESGEQGTADLTPGSNGNSGQCDEDGDCTHANWWVPQARINVHPHGDWLWGNQWAPAASAVITINGTEHSTLPTDEWGDFGDGWDPAGIDLQDGDEIVITDGVTTKTHIVTPLAITSTDVDADVILGTATADGAFDIWVHDSDAWRHVEVGSTGIWSVNWSVPATGDNGSGTADLQPGSNGNSSECDNDGDCTWASWEIPSESPPPEILSFEGPAEPLAFNLEAFAEATFVDPDQDNGHSVELDWGDGTVSHPVPVYEDGVGSISDSHLYGEPGIYTLTVTVTDGTGETATQTYEYAVMYDPAGQKILATVRAADGTTSMHLSVNVKPDKKTGLPKGHVRFNPDGSGFASGFEATEIEYLLIFGDWGIVTGTGTIDGAGEYGFLVSALDQSAEGGVDAFRVLIWNDDGIVFDSQPSDDRFAMPTTVPTSGDIKVK